MTSFMDDPLPKFTKNTHCRTAVMTPISNCSCFFLVYTYNWSRDDAMMPFKVNTTHKKFSTVTCNFFNWILKRKINSGNFFCCSAMKQHLASTHKQIFEDQTKEVLPRVAQRAGRRSKFLPNFFLFLLLSHLLGTFKVY